MTFKIISVIAFVFSMLSLASCKDKTVSPSDDVSGMSPRAFLFATPANTIYGYSESQSNIDTNGVETATLHSPIQITETGSTTTGVQNTSVSRYSTELDARALVANDLQLWQSDSIGTAKYRVYLAKPFALGAVFSSDTAATSINDTRIISTSGSITISGQTYPTIGTVRTASSTGFGSSSTTIDSTFFGVGIGLVKQSIHITVTFPSGKKASSINTIEIVSITKP